MGLIPDDPDKRREMYRKLREWQRRSVRKYQQDRTRKPMKKVNRKRKQKRHRKSYGSEERVLAIKALPCTVPHCKRSPSDNAHTETGGMSMKASWRTVVPLCRLHHQELDQECGSVERFDDIHQTDLRATAERLAREYPVEET